MPKKLLDDVQRDALLAQVGGVGVAQGVEGEVGGQASRILK